MNGAVERFDEGARRRVDGYGRTVVRDGELLRHPVYTRVLHWGVAIFFILALLTGLAIYSPWLYRALTPLFGGGAMTRAAASVVQPRLRRRLRPAVPELAAGR